MTPKEPSTFHILDQERMTLSKKFSRLVIVSITLFVGLGAIKLPHPANRWPVMIAIRITSIFRSFVITIVYT